MIFHLQRAARQALGADDSFFTARGDITFPTLAASQRFAQLVNDRRAAGLDPGPQVQASHVNAMGLLHEVFHGLIASYRTSVNPGAFGKLRARLTEQLGATLDTTLLRFVETFPPPVVYAGTLTPQKWLEGSDQGTPRREVILEELILLWLGNQNPAYAPIRDLISDEPLRKDPGYLQIIQATGKHFETEPGFGPGGLSLLELLLSPIRHAPADLNAQLAFMRSSWGMLLEGHAEMLRLLLGLDFMTEESKWFARRGHQAPMSHDPQLGPQTFAGPGYEAEPEQFSPDTDWMPRVVMLAKSTFVSLTSSGSSTAPRSGRSATSPTPSSTSCATAATPRSGSSACGAAPPRRRRSRSSTATPRRWPPPTRSSTTRSRRSWAATRPTRCCARSAGGAASGSPATWCPTTWASTRRG